jgi:hypothetical protein
MFLKRTNQESGLANNLDRHEERARIGMMNGLTTADTWQPNAVYGFRRSIAAQILPTSKMKFRKSGSPETVAGLSKISTAVSGR